MILDIVIIALLGLGAFTGYKKGLIGILFSLIGTVAAIIMAFLLQTTVANSLYNTGVGESLRSNVSTQITKIVDEKVKGENSDKKTNFYNNMIDSVLTKDEIDKKAEEITLFVLKGVSFVLVFVVVSLIAYILQMILNIVFNLPILNSVNSIGGLAAGIVKMLVWIYIILAIIYFMSTSTVTTPVVKMVENTTVTKILYNNNVFVNMISGGIKK